MLSPARQAGPTRRPRHKLRSPARQAGPTTRATAKRRAATVPWWLLVLAAVVLLAVIGIAAFYWMEGSGLSKASALMAEGDFRGAASVLRPLQGKTMFHGRETDYLLAVAVLRQYAAAPDARNLPDNFTAEPVDRLRLVLQAVPKWRDRARSDHLTDLITTIPEKAPDELARAALLADILQKAGVGRRAGAGETIAAAAEGADRGQSRSGRHPYRRGGQNSGPRSDHPRRSAGGLAPRSGRQPAAIGPLRRLATEDRTLAKTLLEGMSERAGRLWKAGRQIPGDAMLAAADAVCPSATRLASNSGSPG